MAKVTYTASLTAGELSRSNGDPVALASTLSTAMGVLVADGASPTEAHVTTANAALTALLAAMPSSNIALVVDLATVTDTRKLKTLLDAIYLTARRSGDMTVI